MSPHVNVGGDRVDFAAMTVDEWYRRKARRQVLPFLYCWLALCVLMLAYKFHLMTRPTFVPIGLSVFGTWILTGWLFRRNLPRIACPRCGKPLGDPEERNIEICDHCHLRFDEPIP
jgi:hypothetical protein